ncbi:hypothetical protein [Pseudomonas protegens]|uniref:hypothetical protein n=1 Tax=Pseudomonas protegens TaxID=380021 RepID=UPI0011B2103B|nr:hypothetical protein [Pseudomonas protegens]
MKVSKNDFLWAMGSVMDVHPLGDYKEHLPGTQAELMRSYWEEAGRFLGTAIEQHNQAETICKDEPNHRLVRS